MAKFNDLLPKFASERSAAAIRLTTGMPQEGPITVEVDTVHNLIHVSFEGGVLAGLSKAIAVAEVNGQPDIAAKIRELLD
jgi:hypothetical protein